MRYNFNHEYFLILAPNLVRVLVTGAEGFIGSHLLDKLDDAVGIDKKSGSSTADFEYLEALVGRRYKPDMIVHLGANCSSQVSLRDPLTDFTDNVVGTFNVCEVARRYGLPVIFNSSMKVYPGEDGLISPYGQSKFVGEQYLGLYQELYGLRCVINRPSSVYGPRQNASDDGGWFTWFIRASLSGELINLYGDGTQSRDVLYVDDHVKLLLDQIHNFDLYAGQELDFGGGPANEVSLNQLLSELDYDNTQTRPKLAGDVKRFVCNNKEVHSVNGWRPAVGWREGLKLTKEYFK